MEALDLWSWKGNAVVGGSVVGGGVLGSEGVSLHLGCRSLFSAFIDSPHCSHGNLLSELLRKTKIFF